MQLVAKRECWENLILPAMLKSGPSQDLTDQERKVRENFEAEVVQGVLGILIDMVYTAAPKIATDAVMCVQETMQERMPETIKAGIQNS